tara:strand:+ start:236 stop:1471 length:1236 start_codon:yes stop_codon:yes gene_type:complete
MATYGEYKIISDRSGADLQNTIAKATEKSVANYIAIEERAAKERRMFNIRSREKEEQVNKDQAAFVARGKDMAKGINDSFNESYGNLLNEKNNLTILLEGPNPGRKESKEARTRLSLLDGEIAAVKDNQALYIGATATMKEKLSNPATQGNIFGWKNLKMGKDKINKDGGVAQDIANQLVGQPGEGDTFTTDVDGNVTAKGTYLDIDGNEIKYETYLSKTEAESFLKDPTYNYIKPIETAVKNLEGTFLTKNGDVLETFRYEQNPEKIVEVETITNRVITGDDKQLERREKRMKVNSGKIQGLIDTEANSRYDAFLVNPSREAQVQALNELGLEGNDLYLLNNVNKPTDFKELFIERITTKIEEGVINTNKNNGKGLFKDKDKEEWYFIQKISDTDIKNKVSDEFNTPEEN